MDTSSARVSPSIRVAPPIRSPRRKSHSRSDLIGIEIVILPGVSPAADLAARDQQGFYDER
jgi:hypothetical protein